MPYRNSRENADHRRILPNKMNRPQRKRLAGSPRRHSQPISVGMITSEVKAPNTIQRVHNSRGAQKKLVYPFGFFHCPNIYWHVPHFELNELETRSQHTITDGEERDQRGGRPHGLAMKWQRTFHGFERLKYFSM